MGVTARKGVLLGFMALMSLAAGAQQVPTDKKAQELVTLAEKYLQSQAYAEAALVAAKVAERPLNTLTTYALYLEGLARWKSNDASGALNRLQLVLLRYPQSRYADDVQYLKAQILLKQPEKREAALYLLLNLAEQSTDATLQQRADATARQFLFHTAEVGFLQSYYSLCRASYKPVVQEAWAWQLTQAGRGTEAQKLIRDWRAQGQTLTPALATLLGPEAALPPAPDEVRVAVVLPFYTQGFDSLASRYQKVCLQLLQGMQLAAEADSFQGARTLRLQVFDSAGDTTASFQQLESELASLKPHIVIGDVHPTTTARLARWAHKHQTLLVAPLGWGYDTPPAPRYAYQANPCPATAAAALGRYVQKQYPYRRMMILEDGTTTSKLMADAFSESFRGEGYTLERKKITAQGEKAFKQIEQFIAPLEHKPIDAIYLPLTTEELASYAVFRISQDSVETHLIGSERWRGYRSLDVETLSKFQTLISDSYFPGNDSVALLRFQDRYLRRFRTLPSAFSIQGYDVLRCALTATTVPATDTAAPPLAHLKPLKGICQNFYFGQAQDNQSVQILQYEFGVLQRKTPW